MSEEINEIEENDSVEMSHSHSEMDHSHSEMEHTHSEMTAAEFEAKLTEFFTKHKEKKLKFVPQIVEHFKGHETEVLEHLHNKYVLGLVTVKSKKKGAKKIGGHDDHAKKIESGHDGHGGKHDSNEQTKPKSKKKLVIIIIIAVLAGLGVTAFMMKDKLFGKGKGHETEQAGEKGEGEKKADASKSKETDAAKTVTKDSTKAVANDSAKTAGTNAPAKTAADSAKKN